MMFETAQVVSADPSHYTDIDLARALDAYRDKIDELHDQRKRIIREQDRRMRP